MSNHWHMVLSPRKDKAMSAFLGWVTMTHAQRYHAHNKTTGYGHVYQGRYKSFPIQADDHFHTVCRYVERNALTANIVKRAESYRWGSLWNWGGGESVIERVNTPLTKKESDALNCIKRGCPFGTGEWIQKTAKNKGSNLHCDQGEDQRKLPRSPIWLLTPF